MQGVILLNINSSLFYVVLRAFFILIVQAMLNEKWNFIPLVFFVLIFQVLTLYTHSKIELV